jgi:nitrite reductase/ring-hydroxylating ferredoxin subunit
MTEDFERVADESDLPPGKTRIAVAHGIELCLANIDGQVYAISNECPHDKWALNAGKLAGEEIVCAGHGMLINVPNCTVNAMQDSPDNPLIKRYPVKVEDGGIWVAKA